MLPALLLTLLSSLAVVHSQEPVPNISACIAPPSGQATFTILGQQGPEGSPGPIGPKGDEGRVGKRGGIGERGAKGDKGDRGEAGMVGEWGLKGMKGEKGQRGQIGHEVPEVILVHLVQLAEEELVVPKEMTVLMDHQVLLESRVLGAHLVQRGLLALVTLVIMLMNNSHRTLGQILRKKLGRSWKGIMF